MIRVLVVEDEIKLRHIVRDYFTAHDLACDLAADGEEALEALSFQDYDAVLLDVMMPRLDGFTVCREIRKKSAVPILFLTALGGEEDMLHGYALGADDYIPKPFSLAVLLAKTRAIVQRSRGRLGTEALTCGAITLDTAGQTVTVHNVPVRLTSGEQELLACLLRHKGQTLSRDQLLDLVWGLEADCDDRAVDVRIRSLRAALGSAGCQIHTVYRAGYRLEAE